MNPIIPYEPKSIKDFVLHWDNALPFDLWWRKKHNIAFNSSAHKEVSFFDQVFEYKEHLMLKRDLETDEFTKDEMKYNMSQKEIDEEFENLDLKDYE